MRNQKLKTTLLSTVALLAVAVAATSIGPVIAGQENDEKADKDAAVNPKTLKTKYPIKHLVVIFNENISFDHYFGTYPNALNPEGEPPFEPARDTPRDTNNLLSSPTLLDNNPNLNPANGTGATNPFRLDRTQASTADQGHGYTPEQQAYDGGKNDLFPEFTGAAPGLSAPRAR
jgi:phospholipase C